MRRGNEQVAPIVLCLILGVAVGCTENNGEAAAAGSPASASQPLISGCTTVQLLDDGSTSGVVRFRNCQGDFYMRLGCYDDGVNSIGPGYISKVVQQSQNKTIVDDTLSRDKGINGAGGYGGVGAFGFHAARHPQSDTTGQFNCNNAWNVEGRLCASTHGGFGAHTATVIQSPSVSGNVGSFAIDVNLSAFNIDLMRIRYRYQIFTDHVDLWTAATQLCAGWGGAPQPCEAGQDWFIKEPKYAGAVAASMGYKRVLTLNSTSGNLSAYTPGTTGCSGCQTAGNLACSENHPCASGRSRSLFNYAGTPACTDSTPCFNIVARGYPASNGDVVPDSAGAPQTVNWENSSWGLDKWAQDVAGTQKFNADATVSGLGHDTSNLDTCDPTDFEANGAWCDAKNTIDVPGWQSTGSNNGPREWENLGLTASNPAGSVLFNAWSGGRGTYDCENLSTMLWFNGATYGTFFSVSINAGYRQ